MKLTTRGRYAVTAMLDLALHSDDGPVSLADISARQEISLSYLEQLFSRLRRSKLVASTRGPGGGYSLAKPLKEVAVADIVLAVNETVDATQCGGQKNCHQHGRCLTHDLWESLSLQVETFLKGISLHDLINCDPVKKVAEIQDNRVVFHSGEIVSGEYQSQQTS